MAREPRDHRRDQRDERDPRQLNYPTDSRDKRVIPLDPRDERQPGDSRDERTVIDVPGTAATRKAPAAIVAVAYTILGLDLILAPTRWANTPSYGVILTIFPQWIWGGLLLTVAALLSTAVWLTDIRWVSITAHFVAIVFTAGWLIAFISRRVTDDGTTVMNPVTWAVLLAILVYSMRNVEKHQRTLITRAKTNRS